MAGNHNSGRRKATALKLLDGNPGKRPINVREPQPQRAEPDFDTPPPELVGDKIAAAEWQRLAPMVRICGLVTMAERTSLLALCQQWSRYLQAQKKIRSMGMIVKKPSGIPTVNPYMAVADKALLLCMRLWTELGLTPSGRARMSALPAAEPEPVSKWAGLL